MECKVKTPEGINALSNLWHSWCDKNKKYIAKYKMHDLIKQKKLAEMELRARGDVHDSKKLVWSAGGMEK